MASNNYRLRHDLKRVLDLYVFAANNYKTYMAYGWKEDVHAYHQVTVQRTCYVVCGLTYKNAAARGGRHNRINASHTYVGFDPPSQEVFEAEFIKKLDKQVDIRGQTFRLEGTNYWEYDTPCWDVPDSAGAPQHPPIHTIPRSLVADVVDAHPRLNHISSDNPKETNAGLQSVIMKQPVYEAVLEAVTGHAPTVRVQKNGRWMRATLVCGDQQFEYKWDTRERWPKDADTGTWYLLRKVDKHYKIARWVRYEGTVYPESPLE